MAEDLSINISPFNGGHRNSDAIQKNTLFRHLIPTMATSYNSPCRFERKPVAALTLQRFSKNAKHEMLLANHLSSLWLVANALEQTTKEFVAKMEMKLGQKFRYVGCGIEGGYFYMAEAFDVHVVGIDLLVNMISFALERAIGLTCSPQRHILITLSTSFTADKPALFTFFKWLKPGGRVLITDYCKSAETPSPFVQVLRRELEKVEKEKEEFISFFSEK
ncbi:hypothetical protein Bca101_025286 [Brassica carinata]